MRRRRLRPGRWAGTSKGEPMRLVSPTYVTRLRRVLDHLARAGSRGSAGGSVEPHVRCVVADHLGVGQEELAPEVSLRDDLAADSLDLVDLALVLEGEFGITVPEAVLEEVRAYGELVPSVEALGRAREAEVEQASGEATPVPVRVGAPPGPAGCELQGSDWLTASRAGAGLARVRPRAGRDGPRCPGRAASAP